MSTAYIGIGSNIGNREDNCQKAIKLIEKNGIAVRKQSSMYETEPWGIKDQPKFINMAIDVETDKKPEELLRILKEIEKEIGRTETTKWGPRVIDLDILFYDDLILKTDNLEIPHPLMHERDFVLKPLSEIAPDKRHPVTGKTVKKMLNQLSAQ
ncbi:MAG: 2-amino-4-hydroxy-6-hydroxymethyldihydropteridine diphosphokinase [Nitrospirae bacterium]|nr:2-amino-4-hydroxy-6-hydroxymethyldihydropteridine diphosphokinase [Nitrospirota bacterium]